MTGSHPWVRAVRTFDPKAFLHGHVMALYGVTVAGIFVYANVKQYQRCHKMYPDYDKYAAVQGGMYSEAKMQELADVRRYNSMVDNMRTDIRGRT